MFKKNMQVSSFFYVKCYNMTFETKVSEDNYKN